jgi:hypothetical protein
MNERALVLTEYDRLECQVQQSIAICNGDAVQALRVSLVANAFLEAQIEELQVQVSAGYARGRIQRPKADKGV